MAANITCNNIGSPGTVAIIIADTSLCCSAPADEVESDSLVRVTFSPDGQLQFYTNAFDWCTDTQSGSWHLGGLNPALYAVRFTPTTYGGSGNVNNGFTGAPNVWHPLGVERVFEAFGIAGPPAALSSATIAGTFEIRRISDSVVVATVAGVNLRAVCRVANWETACGTDAGFGTADLENVQISINTEYV